MKLSALFGAGSAREKEGNAPDPQEKAGSKTDAARANATTPPTATDARPRPAAGTDAARTPRPPSTTEPADGPRPQGAAPRPAARAGRSADADTRTAGAGPRTASLAAAVAPLSAAGGPRRVVPARPDLIMTPFLAASDMAVSFADPALPDSPLVHVNDAFCELSGHPRDRCVGRNCRFLQGRLTRRSDVTAIRRGIDEDRYLITRLLNYRRSGDLFDNALQIGQLRDTSGRTQFLFGLQWDVTKTLHLLGGSSMEADLEDRTLSPQLHQLARLANHVVRRSNALGIGAAGVPLVERLVAMSRPYQFPATGPARDRATLRALLEYLVEPYLGDTGARFRVSGADGRFDTDVVGPAALWLHELASASRQYGALAHPNGVVLLSWNYTFEYGRPWILFHWHEIKDAALPQAPPPPDSVAENRTGGNGARVVRETIELAGGSAVLREWDETIDATLTLPNGPAA